MSKQTFIITRLGTRPRALSLHYPLLSIVAVLAISGTGYAQSPVGTIANIPAPDYTANAFSTSLRYDSSGDLYAWDGLSVWEQSGGTGNFNPLGQAPAGNQSDAGPISFSQDGQTLLLSNGAGGYDFSNNGGFLTMSASGGMAAQVSGSGVPYTGDALALPAATTIPGSGTKYIVYEGNSTYNGTSLSVFDASAGTSQVVIANGPGATASIAVNPKNNSVYVGIGYGPDAGEIYSFSFKQIDSACMSGTPINFLTGGVLFNPTARGSQSGIGMFFDSNGYLFSGGDGVTVFRPDGTVSYDQSAGAADGYYDTLSYDPANNDMLKVAPYSASPSTGTLFNATAFESVGTGVWTHGTSGSWANGNNWSLAKVPAGGTVSFAGTSTAPTTVTLDGNQAAEALVFNAADSNGYTLSPGTGGVLSLGTTAGAWITAYSGTNTISAPLALANSLDVGLSTGAVLNLSGSVGQAPGVAAALTLSGDGELILSGTSSYTGGTYVEGGTLYVTQSIALPDGTSLTVGADGIFIFDPSATSASSIAVQSGAGVPEVVTAVPEPETLELLTAAGTILLATRCLRRRRWVE